MERIIRVKQTNGDISYGGNQKWFEGDILKKYGCGLVSCTDILLCVNKEHNVISQESYLEFSKELGDNFFKVRKIVGLNGISMAFGMNRFFAKNNLPYKAEWGTGKEKIPAEIERMLGMGVPVCLSVGPCLFKKKGSGVTFYRDASRFCPKRFGVNDHYVTVTGLLKAEDDLWLEISSWGKKFFVSFSEYMNYKGKLFNCFSNILVIKEKKNNKNC